MLFYDEFEHTIDAKGRLAIPAEIRARMHPDKDGEAFYLTLGPKRTLRIYTERGFEDMSDAIEKGLVADDIVAEFDQLIFPMSKKLELDKAGRIRIPERMRLRAKLEKDVVLIGLRTHMEIRNRAQWAVELEEQLAKQSDIFERFTRRRSGRLPEAKPD